MASHAVPAHAEPPAARIVVARSRAGHLPAAERLADAVAVALRAHGIDARRPPAAAAVPSEANALRDARSAYANLHPEEARRLLAALLGRLDASGGAGVTRPQLIDALLLDAMAAQALGQANTADASIDRALAIEPDLAPSPVQYPPTMRSRIDARRAAGAGAPSAVLVVHGAPPQASVYIDAQPLPHGVRRATVATGPHWLRVEASGFEPDGRRIEVTSPETDATVSLSVDAGARLRGRTDPGAPPTPSLRAAAAALRGRLLFVDVMPTARGVRIVARDPSAARSVRLVATAGALAHPASLAARLARGLTATPTRRPRRSSAAVWWVSGGAAAVAIAAVAIVLVATASPAPATDWSGQGTIAR